MQLKTYIVDSFTDEPFKGNPAGVCLIEQTLDAEIMQSIATEINLSETAFVTHKTGSLYQIRYFTPTVEVEFCGHATLASAKVLLETNSSESVEFTTYHGLKLSAEKMEDKIKMKFPLYETHDYQVNQDLYDSFGIKQPIKTGLSKELDMLVIEVEDKETLLSLTPNYEKAIAAAPELKELVVTAKSSDNSYDFYSRCFCPWIGINEDPVTGAAHSVLAQYWSQKLNKKELKAFQVSERGGYLDLRLIGDSELEVVSNAKIVLEGVMKI